MANNQPIGVFDSGVGGLSVLKSIHQQLHNEHLIYLADSRYIPYGEKEATFIIERSIKVTDYLLTQSIKALVIACNTATAAAASVLRARFDALPIIGMEPAVKPATRATRSGKVGVLATSGTLKSARFAGLLDRFASHVEVFAQPCPGLVECIEAGDLTGKVTRELLVKYLQPLISSGCDTIILGCTHYPFLRPLLLELLPPSIELIETGAAVTRHLEDVLISNGLQADTQQEGTVTLLTTDNLDKVKPAFKALWQGRVDGINSVVI